MKIFVDNDFKCYTEDDGTRTEYEVSFFDLKCKEYIEGYRYVPQGEMWHKYYGEMITPWKPYYILDEIQTAVDRTQNEANEEIALLIDQLYLEDLKQLND